MGGLEEWVDGWTTGMGGLLVDGWTRGMGGLIVGGFLPST